MLSSLMINIPPLEPGAIGAAAGLLPIVAVTGVELTLVQVSDGAYAASCRIPPAPAPLSVTGSSMADCLSQLLVLLTPTEPAA